MTQQPLAVVIGASPITGSEHLAAAKAAGCDLAVVDTNPQRVLSLQHEYGATPYTSIDLMLNHVAIKNRPIHMAVVATPSALHLEHLAKLAQARRDGLVQIGGVLLEKPPWLPQENEAAQQLISEVEEDGLKVGVGMTTLFDEAFQDVVKAVDDGRLGAVIHVEDEINFQVTPQMGLPPNYFQPPQAGGGTMLLNGVHGLHRVDKLARRRPEGHGQVKVLAAVEDRPEAQSKDFTPAADFGHFHVDYPSGVSADVKVAWTEYPPEPSRLVVVAERGTAAIYNNGDSWKITEQGPDVGYTVTEKSRTPGFNKFHEQFNALNEWLATGNKPAILPTLRDLSWTMDSLRLAFEQVDQEQGGESRWSIPEQVSNSTSGRTSTTRPVKQS